MSQVELHAVNHTAFPRYERAAKRALEVVLSPGDALYIPPYWLHQVTALSGPCSASVSVHTDSDSARIRDQMLSHQLPIRDEWAAPQRAAALAVYVTALFSSQAERQTFVARLLAARYDPLAVDARVLGNSPGLAEVIESAREGFSARFSERGQRVRGGRAQLSGSVVHVVREHAQRFARITRRIDGRGGLLRHQKAVELGNYIEDVVAAAIGAEWVSRHDITGIWVAFFSRCQRYRVADSTRIPTLRMTRGCQLRRGLGYGMPPACFTPGMCVAMPAACPLPLPSV